MSDITIKRIWQMPNSNTFDIKPIKELITKYIDKLPENAIIIDPFANKNKLANLTNDLDPQYDTNYHMDATDFLKSLEDNKADMVLWDPPYCYAEGTEVLTKNGFKNIENVTKNDFLATLNTNTGQIEYQHPTEVIHKEYKGKMINIDGKNISLLVTPNHRCYAKNKIDGNYEWVEAKDLFDDNKKIWFKQTCDFKGYHPQTFILPTPPNYPYIKEKSIDMTDWLKFIGIFMTYGICQAIGMGRNRYSRKRYFKRFVRILKVNPKINSELYLILDKYHFNFQTNNKYIDIYDLSLWHYLNQFNIPAKRHLDESYKMLSKEQLRLLIEYIKPATVTNKNTHYTISERMHNDFCEIAIKAGYAITTDIQKNEKYDKIFVTNVLEQKETSIKQRDVSEIDFDGTVYCVSVPNTSLLVRRQGKVFWCGNSPRQVSECYKKFDKTVDMKTTQASYWSNQKKEIGRLVKKGGYVITCSWNSGGVGKKYGFEIVEILLVSHGGWHNDTIVVVEQKI